MRYIYNDIPRDYQIDFQEEGSIIQGGIIDLSYYIFYYLIFILIFVCNIIISYIWWRKRDKYIRYRTHSFLFEFIWTLSPALLLIFIAIPSLKFLYASDDIFNPIITLKAIGHQWYWSYEINDFINLPISFDSFTILDSNDLHFRLLDVDAPVYLPINTPIRLLVTATDVIHSFFVPSLGVKIDGIPGRINHASLYILREGSFYGQCAELCGGGHPQMSILINGVTHKKFLSWILSF